MSNSVREIDHGWKDLRDRMKRLRGSHAKIGILAGSKHKDKDGKSGSLVTVAAAQEFGTEHIPSRSFIRSTHDQNKDRIARVMRVEADEILAGRKTPDESLAQVGLWMQGLVVAKIDSNIPPENAPETIALKGSSHTLIDTGQLKQQIRYQVVIKGA